MNEQLFARYRKRLVTEGIIKAALWGTAIFLGINLISTATLWLFAIGSLLAGAIAGLVLGTGAAILLYAYIFTPTDREVARRIDRLGLEERVITMLELRENDSFMASRQRRDAGERLAETPEGGIKYRIPRRQVIWVAVLLVFSLGLTVLAALAEGGIVPYGKDLFVRGGSYSVDYAVKGSGSIRGESEQSVPFGEDGSPVFAYPDDGWCFSHWDDGATSPERFESGVRSDLVITAIFVKIDSDEDFGDEGDDADDTPLGPSDSSGSGGSSDEEGGDNPESGGEGNGGGKWQDKNQFIDGATYYRDYLELYYKIATRIFGSDSEIPDEVIEFFEAYFSGI